MTMIHDGVRPLIDMDTIERVLKAAKSNRAVITALRAKETVKETDAERRVVKTHDRNHIWLVQTPQVFRYDDILRAHHQALEKGWTDVTDDALLVERMGIPVKVIEGSEHNIKVTTPHDLRVAEWLLEERERGR